MGVNSFNLQGRLVKDPELRQTQNGKDVCSFTVAWSEKFGQTENKLFLRVTAWKESAQFVSKYFRKGQECVVEGKLTTREFTDRENVKRQSTEMTLNKIHFCGPKQQSNELPERQYDAPHSDTGMPDDSSAPDTEIPF